MCIHYTCLYKLTCPTSPTLTIACHQSLCFLHTLAAMTLLVHLPEISFCYGSGHKPSPNFSRFSPNHPPPLIIHPTTQRHIRASFIMTVSCLILLCLPYQTSSHQGLICSPCCTTKDLRIVNRTYTNLKIRKLTKYYITHNIMWE